LKVSGRVSKFTESVIREMTRISDKFGSINLAQGFPDFDTPAVVIEAAIDALQSGHNQYSITWGSRILREAIAAYYERWYNLNFDPESEITVCCGSTEAMISSIMAVVDPGDEIIAFEPFYENYTPDAVLSGATIRFVPLDYNDGRWEVRWDALEQTFNKKTAAIIINTPNNPTGKIFNLRELQQIGEFCRNYDACCITDEIYDHILFDGRRHIPPAEIPALRDRTITINSLSKTFAVTGWRVGWACAPAELTNAIRKVHDFVTVAAPSPLQEAGARVLQLPDYYFSDLAPFYQQRRDFFSEALAECGFKPSMPHGAYYMMADISAFGWDDDVEFARYLAKEIGVAVVPGSSFFSNSADGSNWVRFCFSKKLDTLQAAANRLKRLKGLGRRI
jgi:aminotransferase